tara:strand:+ start:472 stop:585 length:114 start_codon:yes stop_codon:yes gene_type:complete
MGIAKINPVVPNNNPARRMIIKISRGCDLTLFEKIKG